MAENLNEYFSSVFTREDISALPVPGTKFEGRESDFRRPPCICLCRTHSVEQTPKEYAQQRQTPGCLIM